MHKLTILLLIVAALVLAACDEEQPPTQIVMQVTVPSTPVVVVVTPTDADGTVTASTEATTPGATISPAATSSAVAPASTTSGATQPPATQAAVPLTPTDRPEIFPTNVTAEVPLAEQVFEHGRMFWIRHNKQIWVMVARGGDPNSGDWYCYNDSFVEGEAETDPSLVPPENRYQPRRGFGKLWRENTDLKDGLGWGVTPEFELTSQYTYIAGGYVQDNKYFPGPGEHRLTTLYNDVLSFFEGDVRGDCQGGTWRMTPAPQ